MSEKPIWHRVLAIVGGGAFIGSTVFAITSVFRDALTQPVSSETTEPTIEERLATQERGYEKVLQREPQNQVALEGLVFVRLQMQDARGAIRPLSKLVQLFPERRNYKILLEELQEQVGESQAETRS
ncbi:MAG: tetratricopeptide repeat protein [Hormoscilla sp. GUM202]|nr:tetratricopeptide repeat protein [Hormoscilla sp. GUM202]